MLKVYVCMCVRERERKSKHVEGVCVCSGGRTKTHM